MTQDSQEGYIKGYPEDEVKTGERVCESPITGEMYRVTQWVEKGEDRVIALEKEKIEQ